MSKQKFESAVQKELERLNNKIDRKIIRGLPYGKEARRHKFLLTSLDETRSGIPRPVYYRRNETHAKARPSPLHWFTRSVSFMSSFLL